MHILNIPSLVSFGHFYASFRKCLSGMPCIFEKNISKFIFENLQFKITDAFKSLRSLSKNRTRAELRLWYRLHFFEINRICATGDFVVLMLFYWYCHRGYGCGKIITLTLKIFNILGDLYTRDGTSHFVNVMQVHRSLWVITTVPKFWIHSVRPLLGHQMTWSSKISVNASCALSNKP